MTTGLEHGCKYSRRIAAGDTALAQALQERLDSVQLGLNEARAVGADCSSGAGEEPAVT
jgi:hypothetical protein